MYRYILAAMIMTAPAYAQSSTEACSNGTILNNVQAMLANARHDTSTRIDFSSANGLPDAITPDVFNCTVSYTGTQMIWVAEFGVWAPHHEYGQLVIHNSAVEYTVTMYPQTNRYYVKITDVN